MDAELVLALFISVSVLYFIYNKIRGLKDSAMSSQLPGPRPLPLFGNIFNVDAHDIHHSFDKMAKRYGAIFKANLFGQNFIVINDSQLLKEMFATTPHGEVFNNRAYTPYAKYLAYDSDNFVFGQSNKKTMIMRKIYVNGLKHYGDGNEHFEELTETILKRLVEEIKQTNGNDFDLRQCIRKSFGNATSSFLMGETAGENDWKLIYEFIDIVNLLQSPGNSIIYKSLAFVRFLPGKFGRYFRAAKIAKNHILQRYYYREKIYSDREQEEKLGFVQALRNLQHEENTKQGNTFITERNVKALILDTAFAATETTVVALINSLALLVKRTDVSKRIQAEIDKVLGTDFLPRSSYKSSMPYTMATIWEVLRYTSHIPLSVPHMVSKNYVFKGYFIPKNAILFPNLWYIHHDPKIWKDPWVFMPERFLDSDGKLLSPDHKLMQNVLPFATGQRKCPAETMAISRMFLYIVSVLQTFDLVSASSGELPETDPRQYEKRGGGVYVAKDFMCRAIPRN